MNKEERARGYAKDCTLCPTLDNQDEIDKAHQEAIEMAYLAGYTQAEQDQSSETAQLRDILHKIINESETMVIPNSRFANNSEYPQYIEIDDFEKLTIQAKQLLTTNAKEQ